MLEFKITQELKPNPKLLELIKDFTYKTKKGKVKVLLNTNLQFIEPTEYLITYPITITILEYKVNEISNKPFYIKERKEKYNLKEIETFSNAMLKDRNVGMKNKFNEYFNGNKKVFYMVGAAHLIGDDGLASLLEKEGYKVTRVN